MRKIPSSVNTKLEHTPEQLLTDSTESEASDIVQQTLALSEDDKKILNKYKEKDDGPSYFQVAAKFSKRHSIKALAVGSIVGTAAGKVIADRIWSDEEKENEALDYTERTKEEWKGRFKNIFDKISEEDGMMASKFDVKGYDERTGSTTEEYLPILYSNEYSSCVGVCGVKRDSKVAEIFMACGNKKSLTTQGVPIFSPISDDVSFQDEKECADKILPNVNKSFINSPSQFVKNLGMSIPRLVGFMQQEQEHGSFSLPSSSFKPLKHSFGMFLEEATSSAPAHSASVTAISCALGATIGGALAYTAADLVAPTILTGLDSLVKSASDKLWSLNHLNEESEMNDIVCAFVDRFTTDVMGQKAGISQDYKSDIKTRIDDLKKDICSHQLFSKAMFIRHAYTLCVNLAGRSIHPNFIKVHKKTKHVDPRVNRNQEFVLNRKEKESMYRGMPRADDLLARLVDLSREISNFRIRALTPAEERLQSKFLPLELSREGHGLTLTQSNKIKKVARAKSTQHFYEDKPKNQNAIDDDLERNFSLKVGNKGISFCFTTDEKEASLDPTKTLIKRLRIERTGGAPCAEYFVPRMHFSEHDAIYDDYEQSMEDPAMVYVSGAGRGQQNKFISSRVGEGFEVYFKQPSSGDRLHFSQVKMHGGEILILPRKCYKHEEHKGLLNKNNKPSFYTQEEIENAKGNFTTLISKELWYKSLCEKNKFNIHVSSAEEMSSKEGAVGDCKKYSDTELLRRNVIVEKQRRY